MQPKRVKRERVCVLTRAAFVGPDRDLSINVMTYSDGSARVYDRDNVDPRLTGAAFNRGKPTTDVPYFSTLHAAVDHLIAVNGDATTHPVQVPASEVQRVLGMTVAQP